MKTQIRRYSRAALSVLLTLCLVASCFTVAVIGTDAAKLAGGKTETEAVTGAQAADSTGAALTEDTDKAFDVSPVGASIEGSVGADEVYFNGSISNSNVYKPMYVYTNGDYFYNVSISKSDNWKFRINSSTDYAATSSDDGNRDIYDYGSSSGKTVVSGTSHNFFWKKDTGGAATIWLNAAKNKTWVTSGTTAVPTNNVTLATTTANAVATIKQNNTTIAEGGTAALVQGQNATLTVTPDSGYIPQKVTIVTGTEAPEEGSFTKSGSNYVYTFAVPAAEATTVTFTMKYVVLYTATPQSNTNGTVSVNPTSAEAGTNITVTATPKRGFKLQSVSVDDADTTVTQTSTGGSFDMPAKNVKVSAVFVEASSINITAKVTSGNGYVTVKIKNSGSVVESKTASEADGATGVSATAYEDETFTVTTSPASGYQNDTLTVNGTTRSSGYEETVTSSSTNPTVVEATFVKSTAPNQYTASLGSGTTNTYNKIRATFFDYYTHGEFENGWITGIGADEYKGTPFTELNTALREYARTNSLNYPIYFGDFYNWSDIEDDGNNPAGYHFKNVVNNSQHLTNEHTAVLGLTGTMLSSSGLPTYFKDGAANQGVSEMKLFDKNWLTYDTENGKGELASIIDSPFPMEIQTKNGTNGTHTYYEFDSGSKNLWFENLKKKYDNSVVYLDTTANTGSYWYAHFFNDGNTEQNDVPMTVDSGNVWKATNPDPSKYTKVIFCKMTDGNAPAWDWGNVGPRTGNLSCPTGENKDLKFVISSVNNNNISGDWAEYSGSVESAGPTVNYSSNSNDAVYANDPGDHECPQGIYPFDRANKGGKAKDLGFGVSMEIVFTLGPEGKTDDGSAQVFEFTGDDDLWVYVDDHLVLDLGGDHKKTSGTIDFNKLQVMGADNTQNIGAGTPRNQKFGSWTPTRGENDYWFDTTKATHTMKIFYLERGMWQSNLKFGFSMYPVHNAYEVEKEVDVDTNSLNAGLKNQYRDTFTFTNYSTDPAGEGNNAPYKVYKTSDNSEIDASTNKTTDRSGEFTIGVDQYAKFSDRFTVKNKLRTVETTSGYYKYDTSYKVLDMLNNEDIILAGDGRNTGDFTYFTTIAGADPEVYSTVLRTRFTNVLKTCSFMITKTIQGYDDTETEFPFKVTLKMSRGNQGDEIPLSPEGLVYRSSLDNFSTDRTLDANGIGKIHEFEYVLFEGIPLGADVTVSEPATGTYYTVNYTGNANCYKMLTIDNNSTSGNEVIHHKKNEQSTEYTDVTIGLEHFDTVTITNIPKTYRMDYKFRTRLYGDKIYKITGMITPDMVANGTVEISNENHTAYLTRKFASENIPYEANFMKNTIWASQNWNHKGHKDPYDDYAILTSTSADKTFTVKIDADGNDGYETTVSGLTCGQSIQVNNEFVEGANGTPSYWAIYKMDELTGTKGGLLTKCYSTKFNYVAYDNYFVDAVYTGESNYDLYLQDTSAAASSLGVTRNHWNDTVSGEADEGKYNLADTEYDRLYLDFILAYEAEGKLISTYGTNVVSTGYEIVILDENGDVDRVAANNSLENTDLDNKNRVHVYYGFKNTLANRGYSLGIRPYITYNGVRKDGSIMRFELDTVGSKGASSDYDTTKP